jgi:hypothetical protein
VGLLEKKIEQYQRWILVVALPREGRDSSKFNRLGKGLGKGSTTVFQYILEASPKPSL